MDRESRQKRGSRHVHVAARPVPCEKLQNPQRSLRLPAMRQQCSSAAQTADPARKRFDRRRNNRSLDRARPSTLARRLIVDRPAWDGRLAIIPKRYVRYILCSVAEFEQAMLLSGAGQRCDCQPSCA